MRITEITLRAHNSRSDITRITGYCFDDENRLHDINLFRCVIFDLDELLAIMDDTASDICEAYKTEFIEYDTMNYTDDAGDFVRRYYII